MKIKTRHALAVLGASYVLSSACTQTSGDGKIRRRVGEKTSTEVATGTGTQPAVGTETTTASNTATNTGSGTGTATDVGTGEAKEWNVGPGLETCTVENKVWRAVVDRGPAECGEALVTEFCCNESEILRQFPSVADSLNIRFSDIKKVGLRLYQCSKGSDHYTFHWALFKDGEIQYRTVNVNQATPSAGPSSGVCAKVSSTDLGITETPAATLR